MISDRTITRVIPHPRPPKEAGGAKRTLGKAGVTETQVFVQQSKREGTKAGDRLFK